MECAVEIKEESDDGIKQVSVDDNEDVNDPLIPETVLYTEDTNDSLTPETVEPNSTSKPTEELSSLTDKNVMQNVNKNLVRCPYCEYSQSQADTSEKFKCHILNSHSSIVRDCLNCGTYFSELSRQIEHIVSCQSAVTGGFRRPPTEHPTTLLRSQFYPVENNEGGDMMFGCNVCGRRMKVFQIRKHTTLCPKDVEYYRCATGSCPFKGQSRTEVENHRIMAHPVKYKFKSIPTDVKEVETILHKCPMCDGKFWGPIQLNNHIKTMHLGLPKTLLNLAPDLLSKKEMSTPVMKKDLPTSGPSGEHSNSEGKQRSAKENPTTSKHKVNLDQYKQTGSIVTDYTFRCSLCLYIGITYRQFFIHVDTVHPDRMDLAPEYGCFKCTGFFSTRTALNQHRAGCRGHSSKLVKEDVNSSLNYDGGPALKRKRCNEDGSIRESPAVPSAASLPKEVKGKVVKCVICYQIISEPVEEHIFTHKVLLNDQEVFKCPNCPKVAKKLKTLLLHIKSDHNIQRKPSSISSNNKAANTSAASDNDGEVSVINCNEEFNGKLPRSPLTQCQISAFKSLFSRGDGRFPPGVVNPGSAGPVPGQPVNGGPVTVDLTDEGSPPPDEGNASRDHSMSVCSSNQMDARLPVQTVEGEDSGGLDQGEGKDPPKKKVGGRNKAAVNSDDEGSDTSAEASEEDNSEYEEVQIINKSGKKKVLKQFSCDVCNVKFTSGIKFYRHIGNLYGSAAINKRPEVSCDNCTAFRTKSILELDKHRKAMHRVRIRECPLCPGFQTSLPKVMNHHIKYNKHEIKRYDLECLICTEPFKNLMILRGHLYSKHLLKTTSTDTTFYIGNLSEVLYKST